ncbi:MAG: penicillin-binding transpeptidase domain-containing protein, partial [Armatimonadota bacterium]
MARSIQEVKSRRRITRLWPVLAFGYTLLFGRVVFMQTVKTPEFKHHASQDRDVKHEIPASRGRILDRNGKELAFNLDECSVIVYPKLIGDKAKAAEILARNLGLDKADVLNILRTKTRYTVLADSVRVEDKLTIQRELRSAGPKARINGVDFKMFSKRIYPMGAVCAKLVGSVNSKSLGTAGVEQYANKMLAGQAGAVWADFDRYGRPIPTRIHRRVEAVSGKDIVLTIDSRIQYAAQDALAEQVRAYGAKSGSCIVMDPNTGELLAVAEYPTFDPNHMNKVDPDTMTSTSMIHIYEPGSTIKLMTAAGALSSGLQNVTTVCTGRIPVASKVIACPCTVRKRKDNPVTVQKMLQFSCNSESTALARRMGSQRVYDELKLFGLLDHLEIAGLGISAGGMMPDPAKYEWPTLRLANVSFGQGVATTRMNLLNAYAAIANGGTLMNPQFIREVRTAGGDTEKTFKPTAIRRVATKADCDTLKGYLRICVEDGTGKNGQIAGFIVGGKTGSAQMPKESGRGFESGAYCASFIGIAPLNDPKLKILVSVETYSPGVTRASLEAGANILNLTGTAGSKEVFK